MPPEVYPVSQVTRYLRELLGNNRHLTGVWVAGGGRFGSGEGARAQKPAQMVDPEVMPAADARPRFVSRGGSKQDNAPRSLAIAQTGRG